MEEGEWMPTPELIELVRRVSATFYGPMHYIIIQHLLIRDRYARLV